MAETVLVTSQPQIIALDDSPAWKIYRVLGIIGGAAGAYHGYKRNQSVGWAIGWAILGTMFPVITIPVAFAQGFGKKK